MTSVHQGPDQVVVVLKFEMNCQNEVVGVGV